MIKLLTLISLFSVAAFADVNVYTDRDPGFMSEVSKAFTAKTGEQVNVIKVSYSDIKGRLELEGDRTPADLVIYKDLVYMSDLTNAGFLQNLPEAVNSTEVAPSLKSESFVSISMRPRTVVYSSERVKDTEALSYKDLADPKWKGRLCVRTSASSYNQGLAAAMVEDLGAEETASVLNGWVNNFATAPFKSDSHILNAIADGTCDVGVVNSYYYVRALEQYPNYPVSISLKTAPYVNGVAVGMLKASDKSDLVSKYINHLLSDEVQTLISNLNQQFSTTDLSLSNDVATGFGPFEYNQAPWATVENIKAADEIFEAVSYE